MQGKTINGFVLQRLLGKGGMAEVWYAENEIGMKAAVKIMSEMLAHNPMMQERFLNEAKVMVKLDHPNIRKVYGYGNVDDRPAIIMEYLDGTDLKMKMKSGQHFTEEELERWWNQLADALNYTHAQDVVHRDIKPSNIFIDQHGNAKLLDFGIAKVTDTSTGTQTGSTLGTRIYMSPEQVKDPKRVGTPSDVYSLAVSFVHLLSGKAPYDISTSSDYDIQVSIVTKPVDMSKVPAEWQGFLTPYLNKEADQRPALQHFSATLPETVPADEDLTMADMGQNHEAQPAVQEGEGTLFQTPQKEEPPVKVEPKEPTKVTPTAEPTDKPKSKKGLWIALGVVGAIVMGVMLWPKDDAHNDSYYDVVFPTGASRGVFSVSPNKKVHFAMGNLQYQASTDTWRFAEYQWDTIGEGNRSISPTNSGWIDLFGWGTGNNPTKCSENEEEYEIEFVDWGNHGISYNGNYGRAGETLWRTLSRDEWGYVLNERITAQGIRYAKATVNGVKGLILLPDDWMSTIYYLNSTNKEDGSFDANIIDVSTWYNKFSSAVFLPAAGSRRGKDFHSGRFGEYWTANEGISMYFCNTQVAHNIGEYSYHGFSVRLVCSAE